MKNQDKDNNEWIIVDDNPNIRYKNVTEEDPISGEVYHDFRFEIFQRPYFFGLLGKKKWLFEIQTSSVSMGISFCKYLLKK